MEARRSIFSRIVAGAIGLSIVLVLALWFVTHQTVLTTLEDGAAKEVDVDIAGLVDIYATSGLDELAERINDRIALTPSEGNTPHYLLANNAGEVIAGDIARWPLLDPMVSETGEIAIGAKSQGFARAVQLGPDLRLLVARRTDSNRAVLRNIALAFAVGGTLFVLLVALLGRIAALGLQRRIGQINLAFRDPAQATNLAQVSGGDEIDELTGHSARAITRHRNLSEAYKETSEQLAHEMRTPLSHLDNRLLKALEASPTPPVAKRLMEARSEIKRLVQTLESLLDIASSKSRRGERAGLAPVDMSEMVNSLCELYSGSAEETGHSFTWEVEPGVTIDGEERQLSRLITNLLDNALKYVPAGGAVSVTLKSGPELVVADNGPGVAPADRERIFDRFYRGRSNDGDVHGSGLGLALARAIAERHGLTLSLDHTEVGSSFRLKK
ncbi:HAMP domain-containing sensor histidine kinase [Erythrobacter sp. SCSIO 43205]|uniref:sensor histidine kinase n=1 Tax=Erythrobacter sp. SCSIO 43205 TaxID=2779361 RepID=UPI0021045AF6|nr:HAMP domain-containing sensor histidine kinase [Erythrobacter sp. SCSIO 43205]